MSRKSNIFAVSLNETEIMETTEQKTNQTPAVPPKTWLVESILATLFCCLPFGIVGIVYATKVETLFYAGQTEAAEKASRDAGKWTKISFWVGLGCALLYIIFGIFVSVGTREWFSILNA